MTCWVVIPVKAPDCCKTRLRDVLAPTAHRALVDRMFRRVAHAAEGTHGVDAVHVLGPTRQALPTIPDPGGGLNAALASALRTAEAAAVDRLVILPADLPYVTASDIRLLLEVPLQAVVIASDRRRTGTNALSLPVHAARDFRFAYGPGSFARHCATVLELGLAVVDVRSEALAFDIDDPTDLAALQSAPCR